LTHLWCVSFAPHVPTQLVFPSDLLAAPWAVAAFDDERPDPAKPAALVLCVLAHNLDAYRLVFQPPLPTRASSSSSSGGSSWPSVLSGVASCRADGDAVATLRAVPGSSFAAPLGPLDGPLVLDGRSAHAPGCWVSPHQLALGLDRPGSSSNGSQLAVVTWARHGAAAGAAGGMRGGWDGEAAPPRVAVLAPAESSGGGLGLRRVWSGLRGVEVPPNPILAVSPLPPHEAHGGRYLASLHADARVRLWDLSSPTGGGSCLGRATPLPAIARHPAGALGGDPGDGPAFLPLASSGHLLRALPHPHSPDKFVLLVSAAPRAPGRVGAAKAALLCGLLAEDARTGRPASGGAVPRLLRGAAHAAPLACPSLWTRHEVGRGGAGWADGGVGGLGVGLGEAAANAFELKDATLARLPSEGGGAALVWLLWQGDARRPFPIDDPFAYAADPTLHASQVRE
jgi:hypothetical protein